MKEKSEVYIVSRNSNEANAEEEAESVARDLTSHPRIQGSQEEGSDAERRADPDPGPDLPPTQSSLASVLPPQHSISGLTTVDIHF